MKKALVTFLVLLLLVSYSYEAKPAIGAFNFFTDLNIYFNNPSDNATYHTNNLLLNISLENFATEDEPNVIRKAWYSLDGQENISIPVTYEGISGHDGNALPHTHNFAVANLTQLTNGIHNITAYGEFDFSYKTISNSVSIDFTVDVDVPVTSTSPSFEYSPNLLLLIVIILVLVLAIVTLALIIWKKKKSKVSLIKK
jgi:hypothetical protein